MAKIHSMDEAVHSSTAFLAGGGVQVVYGSIAEVDLAFNSLANEATEEASGRLQKKIFLSKDSKKYISVSKNAIVSFHDYDFNSHRKGHLCVFSLNCWGNLRIILSFV